MTIPELMTRLGGPGAPDPQGRRMKGWNASPAGERPAGRDAGSIRHVAITT